jgi:hypothetical protein
MDSIGKVQNIRENPLRYYTQLGHWQKMGFFCLILILPPDVIGEPLTNRNISYIKVFGKNGLHNVWEKNITIYHVTFDYMLQGCMTEIELNM